MGRYRSGSLAAVACVLVGLTACSSPSTPGDRAGGDTLVLRLATTDGEGIDPEVYQGPMAFVDGLERVSGGRIQVELEWDYGAGAADAETQLVEAIANGDVDGGWPASRAFARAGVEGLEAIEAPMLLASEAAVDDLVGGDAATDVLAQLDGSGLAGLGLMAAPLRHPVSGPGTTLVGPSDWNGVTFRVYNSPVQAAAVRALGARPVDMSHAWADALRIGDLDGAESDIVTADLPNEVKHITGNVVLWPKIFVAALNQTTVTSLSEQQQGWVREAARAATEASIDATYDSSLDLQVYCDRGTAVLEATARQIDALRSSLAPVLDDLRRAPETSELMAVVEEVAKRHPQADVPSPEGGCDGSAAHSGIPTTTAPLPEGVYRTEVPAAAAAEVGNGDGVSGIWTLRIEDGTYALTCRPLDLPGTDCGHMTTDAVLEAGRLKGDGHTVWFVGDPALLAGLSGCELPPTEDDPDACVEVPAYSASWRLQDDRLVFSDVEWPNFSLAPWRRIGE